MDKTQITTIILTIIGSGIIAPFSKSIFDKIFAAYNPDPKKISSGIKKILSFTLMYLLPIANLIYIYASHKTVDKYLVLMTVFVFSVLVLNIFLDIFLRFVDKSINVYKSIFDTIKAQQNAHADTAKILEDISGILKDGFKFKSHFSDKTRKSK